MATKKYNPYNSMKKIVDLKQSYDNAKSMNGNYQQYQNEATQYYNDLISNGYVQQAADLSKYGYKDALNYLNNSGWKSDEEMEFDEWYDNIGKVSTEDKRTISEQQSSYIDKLMGIGTGETSAANDQYAAWLDNLMGVGSGGRSPISEQQSSYIDDLIGISKGSNGGKTTDQLSGWLDDMANLSTGKTSPQTSDAVEQLMNQWFADNQTRTDLTTDYQQTGKNQLDYLNNFDYTKQSYFQPIMDSYKLQGSDAANGALASGAASNAGNIDSYAAANANRQQLAFTNAAHQAALAAAMQTQTNWRDIYSLMVGNIADYVTTTAQNLGTIASMYGMDSAERQNAANALYGVYNNAYNTDATERTKAMDVIRQLFGDESVERQAANNVLSQIYSTDANERAAANDVIRQLFGDESAERVNATNAMVDKYLADLGLVQAQYTTDSQERMNTANNEYDLAVQKLANEYGLTVAQMESVLENTKAQLQYDSALAGYEADKYRADKDYEASKYDSNIRKEIQDLQNQGEIDKLTKEYELKNGATSKLDAETAAVSLMNGILDGSFADITDWDKFYTELVYATGDPQGSAEMRKVMEENYPSLFDDKPATATDKIFDVQKLLQEAALRTSKS